MPLAQSRFLLARGVLLPEMEMKLISCIIQLFGMMMESNEQSHHETSQPHKQER
jgi:hypothetical protein